MSWVTLDDGAHRHRKQLAAGAKACWLWTCCLSYCDGQETKDGFIPEAIIKLLYPGLGIKDASALVKVGLLEKVDGGYVAHDYLWWRDRRFAGAKSARGIAGGSVSSEAKRQAAITREAEKRIAQRQNTTSDHNEAQRPTTTKTTTTTSPTDRSGSGPDRSGSETGSDAGARTEASAGKVPCPRGLVLTEDQAATLRSAGILDYAIVASTTRFVGKATADPDDRRSLATWRKCLSSAITGDWNDTSRRPKPPEPETPQKPPERVRTYLDVQADERRVEATAAARRAAAQ